MKESLKQRISHIDSLPQLEPCKREPSLAIPRSFQTAGGKSVSKRYRLSEETKHQQKRCATTWGAEEKREPKEGKQDFNCELRTGRLAGTFGVGLMGSKNGVGKLDGDGKGVDDKKLDDDKKGVDDEKLNDDKNAIKSSMNDLKESSFCLDDADDVVLDSIISDLL